MRNLIVLSFLSTSKLHSSWSQWVCRGALLMIACALQAVPLAHTDSDLKPDASLHWGTLDNGLRYVIMPHNEPPERISMRLYVEAGSLNEYDDQEGIAHFLEHMAFNGTTHFEPEEMVQYFQRLGMAFGADTNAHTGFGETVYKIELPETKEEYIQDGLQVLRDYADGMLLQEEQIEKERGVILAEKRSRESVEFRITQAYWRFLLPDAIFGQRFPIGKKEVIENAPREAFVEFYQRNYRPDNMVVVVVGEVNPDKMSASIKKYFASMKNPANAFAKPEMGEVTAAPGIRSAVHIEKEAKAADISIMQVAPFDGQKDSKAKRMEEIHREAAEYIINRRIEKRTKEEDAKFTRGSIYSFSYLNFFTLAGIDMQSRPEQWEPALIAAENELRRALKHGFTEAETAEANAQLLKMYEQAVAQASTRKSRELSSGIVRSLRNRTVFTSPQQSLAIAKQAVDQATPQVLLEALRKVWDGENRELFVSGNVSIEGGKDALLEIYQKAQSIPVEAPAEEAVATFAYAEFGKASEITNDKRIDKVDTRQIVFANNVRLNIKRTDFEAGKVRIGVRFGRGTLELPKEQPELAMIANSVFTAGGLGKHDKDEIQRIFAGKIVSTAFSVGSDAFTLTGATNTDDLQAQLQLLAAYISDPGFREEALRQTRRDLPEMYIAADTTLEGVLSNEVSLLLHGGDPRFGLPAKEKAEAVTMEAVSDWMQRALRKGYLEVSAVGDLDEQQVIDLVQQTFGALPERRSEPLPLPEARKVDFPQPQQQTFTVDTEIQRAAETLHWKTVPIQDIHTARRLSLLSDIFSDRLRKKIREEIGEAYSPYSYNSSSDTWKEYGVFTALAVVNPESAEVVGDAILSIAEDISQGTVTQDELERAKLPTLNRLEEYQRNNAYWLGRVLMGSTTEPAQLEWAQSIQPDYAAITLEEINDIARQFLAPDKAVRLRVTPKELSD